MNTPGLITALFFAIAALPARSEDMLARYTFTGSSYASQETDPHVAVSDFAADPGLKASFSNEGNPAPSVYIPNYIGAPTATAALVANRDFNFTLTTAPGFQTTAGNLSFEIQIQASQKGAPAKYAVFSSVNAQSAPCFSGTLSAPSDSWNTCSINLSAMSDFRKLTGHTSFYIVLFDGNGEKGRAVRIDNVSLSGSCARER